MHESLLSPGHCNVAQSHHNLGALLQEPRLCVGKEKNNLVWSGMTVTPVTGIPQILSITSMTFQPQRGNIPSTIKHLALQKTG
ncbi:uncharacterized protein LOC141886018 isoform X3 [Acropora palmata]|uniref:uncharacterized protein LOC141886018 isoform X3 n=1 Tax=Acropora palmata TaxID=6131 RepID=UPI003DA070CB